MSRSLLVIAVAILAAIGPLVVHASDWPQFRGPDGQGHSTSKNVPLTWSETEHIAWKVAIPGLGWSSPSIQGDQIWLTTAVDDAHVLRALAIDRRSGKVLHDVEVFRLEEPGSVHTLNSHASPTPVIDGDRVFVHFGKHGTACLATDGQVVWKTQELKYNHGHGPGGSPVVWKDLVIINCDGTDVQYVIALDRATGAVRWKHERQHISQERKTGKLEVPMAYSTPLLIDIDGRTQMVSLGSDEIVGQDPASGEELWWFTFSGYSNVSKPVWGRDKLFFASGFGSPVFYAIKPQGRGDITANALAWKVTKGAVVPLDVSPLVVGSQLYTISDPGVAVCYDADDGKQLWQQRLTGKFWASPVWADGRIYCLDEAATTSVLADGPKFELLATNKLDGRAQASPAIVDGAIFLRTDTHLYRIENR
ncbi:MAG TPA: PQQ-binding-like beta-propeller repeat protein [Pirellulales bacterium]|nr:PQQ-binding-like beta-propeller repeat protein [Pirellulales bacterium]